MLPAWVAALDGPLVPVAMHDLAGRPGFKLALHVAENRWLLYIAHLWHRGWSIVDVTDPEVPKLLQFIDGPPNTWTCQITLAGKLMATSLERILPGWGGDAEQPFDEGIRLWDLSDPLNPSPRGIFRTGFEGSHRNLLDSDRLLHASARMAGYSGAIYVIVDVSDPDDPREIGRFHISGQHVAAGEGPPPSWYDLHGPPIRVGDIVYLPYAAAGLAILDISRIERPRLVGHLPVHPPLGSGIAVHTVVPLPEQNLAIINSEALAERCREPVNFAGLVDISEASAPRLMSLFPTPAPPPGAPYHSFCERGGRFGPHNQHVPFGGDHLLRSSAVCFLTYFNAGLRVYDVRDPYRVEELGYLIPVDPARRIGTLPSEVVVQVEDVLVDERRVVYFTEKNSALYIARWDGPA